MNPHADKLDECLSIAEAGLHIEGCSAAALASRFGTPLYVISEDQLRRNVARWRSAFAARWPGQVLLLPSLKANPVLALRHVLNEEGVGCDVFGPAELDAALRCDTPPELISLNGSAKDPALLERAIGVGARITLDSADELPRAIAAAQRVGRRAHLRLRLRPDLIGLEEQISEMSPEGASVRSALDRYKAGIPTEDLLAMEPSLLTDPAIDLAGVHLHVGRHSSDPAVWVRAVDALAEALAALRERWDGLVLREIDLGGGFPAPRDPFGRLLPQRRNAPPLSPGPDAYAAPLCERLHARLVGLDIDPASIRLELEPGRALYADAGIHLATVRNVKRQSEPEPLTWVEVDSSDAYLPDVNLESSRWTVLSVKEPDAERTLTADVTGRTCALDVIVPDANLPDVAPGDVLAFLDTGAYQEAGANNFNAMPRPGTVLVHGDRAELVRRHETIEDVFARDLVPERLSHGPVVDARSALVSSLDHFSVTCSDLDRSLRFYHGLLGVPVRARGESNGSAEFEIAGMAGQRVRWADLELSHGQVIELIEYSDSDPAPVQPTFDRAGGTHLSLRVNDVDEAYRRLIAAEVPTRTPPVTVEAEGAWQGARAFYASDPDGVTIELIQPPMQLGSG